MSQVSFEPVSTPLEDEIKIPFTLVGSQIWFDTAFEEGAVLDSERLVISSPDQLQPIIAQARRLRVIGVDTETTGPYHPSNKGYALNPVNEDCRIVLLQIGDERHVWIIDPAFIEYFRDVLESTDQLHLAHNWEYDFKWLLVKNKIHPRRMYCSMLAEQLLTAGLLGSKVGLADCARKYEPNYIISKAVRSMFILLDNGKMTRDMVQYAARDIPLLFSVFRAQVKELERHNLKFVAQLEFDNIAVAAEMEAGGFPLDEKKLNLLIEYWTQREAIVGKQILDLFGERRKEMGSVVFIIPELRECFDLESNKDKREALKSIGIKLTDVKRATLLTVDDPIATLLAEYSNITKMTTTYGDNMVKKINPYTGLYHPRFAQMGAGSGGGEGRDTKDTTATGRWVGDAQQYPRKSDGRYCEVSEEKKPEAMARFATVIEAAKAKYMQEEKVE